MHFHALKIGFVELIHAYTSAPESPPEDATMFDVGLVISSISPKGRTPALPNPLTYIKTDVSTTLKSQDPLPTGPVVRPDLNIGSFNVKLLISSVVAKFIGTRKGAESVYQLLVPIRESSRFTTATSTKFISVSVNG
jgi:hypothetical protein